MEKKERYVSQEDDFFETQGPTSFSEMDHEFSKLQQLTKQPDSKPQMQQIKKNVLEDVAGPDALRLALNEFPQVVQQQQPSTESIPIELVVPLASPILRRELVRLMEFR